MFMHLSRILRGLDARGLRRRHRLRAELDERLALEAVAYFRRVRADLAAHAAEPLGADVEPDKPAAVVADPEAAACKGLDARASSTSRGWTTPEIDLYHRGVYAS